MNNSNNLQKIDNQIISKKDFSSNKELEIDDLQNISQKTDPSEVEASNVKEDNTRYGDWVIKGHAVDF